MKTSMDSVRFFLMFLFMTSALITKTDADVILYDTSHLGPFNDLICVDETLTMECPQGYFLEFAEASYGRWNNRDACSADGQAITLTDGCLDPDVLSVVQSSCQLSLEECSFTVTQDLFGEPCPGYINYLNVTYSCQQQVYRGLACEGSTLSLECFGADIIGVQSVLYGRDNDLTCSHDTAILTTNCSNPAVSADVAELCNSRTVCDISVDAAYLGDPCPGTFKYLEIAYTCSACTNLWGDDDECDSWAESGFCESNLDWMYAHCRKSCTRCDLAGTCSNIADDVDCDLWAFTNECALNSDWMHVNCQYSCNQCATVVTQVTTTEGPPTTSWAPETLPEDTIHETACVYEDMLLECPSGYIRVLDAYYGRRDSSVCPSAEGGTLSLCETNSAQAFLVAEALCTGRTSCYLYVDDPPFDDPCTGTENYLEVDFICEPCTNIHGDERACATWEIIGECDSNRYWMTDNCFQSCSRCDLSENCDNTEVTVACDYWASFGECEANPSWMSENCQKSCRQCEELVTTTTPAPTTPVPTPEGTIRVVTCQQFEMRLTCEEEGTHIRILSALYGRTSLDECDDGGATTDSCQADPSVSTAKAREVCDGRQTCYLRPLSPPFEDPCPDSTKYLQVDYLCEPCINPNGDDDECDDWAASGECTANPNWMPEYCFRSCSGCDSSVACENSVGDDSGCDYWTSYGECVNNSDWMIDNCEKSCRLCDVIPETTTTTTLAPTTTSVSTTTEWLGYTSVTACQRTETHLSCPTDEFIRVTRTFYGRSDLSVCPSAMATNTECGISSSDAALELTSTLCNGRTDCYIWVGSPSFEEECSSDMPYMELDYYCEACVDLQDTSACETWAEAGECYNNPVWMAENCFATCSGCLTSETCENTHPSTPECDFWASGEDDQCFLNAEWMLFNCEKSCRQCGVVPETTTVTDTTMVDIDSTTVESTTTTTTTEIETTTPEMTPQPDSTTVESTTTTTTTEIETTTPEITPQPGLCDPVCQNGDCVAADTCQCNDGWAGADCSDHHCTGVSDCNGHGSCMGPNICECMDGYTGASCDTISCSALQDCNNRGTCVGPNQCSCQEGYSGSSCAYFSCSTRNDCSGHGSCVAPETCECGPGYTGDDCSEYSCADVENCNGRGSCSAPNVCSCNAGYSGTTCAEYSCTDVMDCSNHGSCVGPNLCSCNSGYQGYTCVENSCSEVMNCNNHGSCTGPNVCTCFQGYSGTTCDQYNCIGVQECMGQGTCVGPDTCSCHSGYTGTFCEEITCAALSDCSGHGECMGPNTCTCHDGYTGSACSDYSCPGSPTCSGHGECTAPNTCTCQSGYHGDACESYTCSGINDCSGHGTCVGPNTCRCDMGWSNNDCSVFGDGQMCQSLNNCNGHGVCVAPDTCWCYPYYGGEDCNECSLNAIGQACVTCPPCQHGYCVEGDDAEDMDTYMGCYLDNTSSRDLAHVVWTGSTSSTVRKCIENCYVAGYKYAGLQNGDSCYCGDSYGSHGTSTACGIACSGGDVGEMCGGVLVNSIYMTYQGMCQCDGPHWTGSFCDACAEGYSGPDCTPIPTSTSTTTSTTQSTPASSSTSTDFIQSSSTSQPGQETSISQSTSSTTTPDMDLDTYGYMNMEVLLSNTEWRSSYRDMDHEDSMALWADVKQALEVMYQGATSSFNYVTLSSISDSPLRVSYYLGLSPSVNELQGVEIECAMADQPGSTLSTEDGVILMSMSDVENLCRQRDTYCENGGTLLRNWEGEFHCSCPEDFSGWRCSHTVVSDYLLIIVIVVAVVATILVVLIVCCCLKGVCNQKKALTKKVKTNLVLPPNGTVRSFQYHGMAKGMRGTKLVHDQERGISREHADSEGYVPRQI